MKVIGVLLAAGRAERFGGAKLLAPLPRGPNAGLSVGVTACKHLRSAVADVIAVVRPDDLAAAPALEAAGARIVVADRADDGMGASLAAGVAAAPDDCGYLVVLADMPWVDPNTIARIATTVEEGASIVAPRYRGERGHPVGFAPRHREALLALTGDEGARGIIDAHRGAFELIEVDDPGVVQDVDTPLDLWAPDRG